MIKDSLRKLLRGGYLSLLGHLKAPSSCVHILNGHMIDWNHDNIEDGYRFKKQLDILHKTCEFVNFEEAVRLIVNRVQVTKPTLAFSFDDGWRDCYTQIAPQLEKYGVNAMFFINPNFADAADNNDEAYIKNFTEDTTKSPGKQPMTWAQMKDLQNRGFLIGAHTLDHYCINDNNIDELEHQIGDCRKVIEERLGTCCEYFAFPYGRLEHANSASIDIACKHYKYVFSQSDYKNYFSFGGKVINRRHFEPFWPVSHVNYFISCNKKY